MRYFIYQLGVKHMIPYAVKEVMNEKTNFHHFFHSVLPVGISIISTYMNDKKIYLKLIDNTDTFPYKLAFAQIPPVDRHSFLYMLDFIGQISKLCCYRVETVEICDSAISEFFELQYQKIQTTYAEINRSIYLELYGRN
jgi:hypothetical protein